MTLINFATIMLTVTPLLAAPIPQSGELQSMDLKTEGSLEAYVDKLDVIVDIGAGDRKSK